jgi:hypothetical protein
VYRVLRSLRDLSYVAQTDRGGVYELSARLASLGEYGRDVAVRTKALPLMRQLHEAFDETVNLGLLEGLHIRCMQVIEATQALRWIVNPGAMDMLQTMVPGRAIVAYLPSEQQAWFVVKVCATLKGRTRKNGLRGARGGAGRHPGARVCAGGGGDSGGRRLRGPAFGRLWRVAGGRERVDAGAPVSRRDKRRALGGGEADSRDVRGQRVKNGLLMSYTFDRSQELSQRAQRSIVAGVNCGLRKMEAPVPLYFVCGGGPIFWEMDDHHYLDFQLEHGGALLRSRARVGMKVIKVPLALR